MGVSLLLWQMLAQGTPAPSALDGLPGAPAWVGTGLLGGVLGWLLFVHLPAKDKQIAGLIADRDRAMEEKDKRHELHVQALVKSYADQDRERRADYRESLAAALSHCEKEFAQIGERLGRDFEGFRQLMEDVRQELRRARGGGPPQ